VIKPGNSPPALLAIPIVGRFWFKGAELEVQAERFREEMRERMEEIEDREEYDDY